MKLEIELVPKTVWESSLYRLLPKKVWNKIRSDFIREYGEICQICGYLGVMNLHEIWNYDDEKHIQKLEGFILLCKMCHFVKHFGLVGILSSQGKIDYNRVIKHFCKVNNCSKKYFESHRTESFIIWEKRSKYKWIQDFGKYQKFIKKN